MKKIDKESPCQVFLFLLFLYTFRMDLHKKTIILVTANSNKLNEINELFLKNDIVGCRILGCFIHIDEIQGSIQQICEKKTANAFRILSTNSFYIKDGYCFINSNGEIHPDYPLQTLTDQFIVMVENTYLGFSALKGLPGPFTRCFFNEIGCEGLINMLSAYEDKSSVATCAIGFCSKTNPDPHILIGECFGTIITLEEFGTASTEKAFGWDPIFVPNDFVNTFETMDLQLKIEISHRTNAFDKFICCFDNCLKSVCASSSCVSFNPSVHDSESDYEGEFVSSDEDY